MNEILRSRSFDTSAMLAFTVGVCAVQQLATLPAWPMTTVLSIGALILAGLRRTVAAAALAGFVWAIVCGQLRLADRLPAELERKDLLIEGEIASLPEISTADTRFLFAVSQAVEPADAAVPALLRLDWYQGAPALKAGQRWRLAVRLKRPHGMSNPGGMDYELWLFAHGIGATGYVRAGSANGLLDPPSVVWSLQRWRQAFYDRLQAALVGSPFAGVHTALVMGDERGIGPAQWDVLRRTGTAHLIAISGSHIALIAGWVFVVVRWSVAAAGVVRWPPPSVAALVASAVALAYSALADFAIPTRRALLMLAVVMAGIALRRNLRTARLLVLACFLVVLFDPLAVTSAGFWLSFGAVAVIVMSVGSRLASYHGAIGLWRVNWATAVGLAPMLLLFFRQIPLVSPLANLIAVPLFGLLIIPFDLLAGLVAGAWPDIAAQLFALTDLLLKGAWWLLEWLDRIPGSQWRQPEPPAWALVFAGLGTLWLLLPRGFPARWLGLLMCLPALTWRPPPIPANEFELDLLDVGQGLAAVVRTRDHVLVFDTGSRFSDRFDAGSAIVEPFLRERGVGRIDTLVISHGDQDHVGGAAALAALLPIERTYSSVPGQSPGASVMECIAGQNWTWDGVRFEFLWPVGAGGSDNDRSCVLRVAAGEHAALLTGDIERSAETALVARSAGTLHSEVLIVPHHGSDTSSTAPFLHGVAPRYALIPAGYLNRYGFPHAGVIRRIRDSGALPINSADSGTITLRVAPGGISEPIRYRFRDRRYWRAID